MIAAAMAALWLGLLTSIGPCTLTMNLLAVGYLARRVDLPWAVAAAGLSFTVGTVLAYVALGMALSYGVLTGPAASHFLQKNMNQLLGPALILAGLVLLGWIPWRLSGSWSTGAAHRLAERGTPWGAFLLGVVFALTFCPVSAALFFVSLLSLSVRHGSVVALPAFYGLGCGIPVLASSLLLAWGAGAVGRWLQHLQDVERWLRAATAWAFVGIGVHLCLSYVFGLY